ncbi:MAG: transporter substrate-binding domain-containing protein [Firmicutes bacterium]|nr:transporter substrate-binding domain-containing protein [Bacillota bacterium]MCM1401705.1 transporter substrate-binding domain-containing protein [Bacteroides sp.]MCM1477961.1 transporter substrate-binding domain-containing protein [Bacteroides sp.]
MQHKVKKFWKGQAGLYLLLLAVAAGMMIGLKVCSSPPAGPQKQHTPSGGDTIDVAISYSPMTFYRYADTLGGFSYDMLREIARRNNMALKFHPVTSLTAMLQGLDSGLYDVVVSDMARTSDIDSTRYTFTSHVYLDRQVLVQRRDNSGSPMVDNQLQLGGRRVWVEAASPAYGRIHHLSQEIGDTIHIMADSNYTSEQLFLKVAVGDIPLAVVNEKVALLLAKEYPEIDISTSISFTQFQAWLVNRRDTLLLRRLNTAIDTLRNSSFAADLEERYSRPAKEKGLEKPQ